MCSSDLSTPTVYPNSEVGDVHRADQPRNPATVSKSHAPTQQRIVRTGKLSQEADRVLKDIDRQMQSLPAAEAANLKTQFNTLLDVSTCIIDREQFDPANLTQQEKKQLQNAAHALRQQIPVTDVSSEKKPQQQRSLAFRSIQNTLQQLSRQLGAELRTILREAARAEQQEQPKAPPTFNPAELQQLRDQCQKPPADHTVKAYTSALLEHRALAQNIFQTIGQDMLVPGLGHGNSAMLQQQHEMLQQSLAKLTDPAAKQAAFSLMSESQQQMVGQIIDWSTQLERNLQLSIDLHADYSSPDSIQQVCHAKQIDVRAAIQVLQNDRTEGHSALIGYLEQRWQALEDLKLAPGSVDVGKLLGKKAIQGIGQLRHPIDAARQSINLEKAVNKIWSAVSSNTVMNVTSLLELDGFDEPMLMCALLKKAGISDATREHSLHQCAVLDSQSWQVVRSDIVVPLGTEATPELKRLESVATPASHVLANPAWVMHADSNAVLNPPGADEYLHTGSDGQQVRGGFISHDLAESNHALMACHDELRMDGKLLFGATRHAVHAPFGLPAELKAMDPQQARAFIAKLIGPTERPPTVESIHYPNAAIQSAPPASSTNLIANSIGQSFRNQLQQQLDREQALQQGLADAGFAPTAANTPQPSVEDLLAKPKHAAELAARVQQDPALLKLVIQQGALNRAREAIIMEIARSPTLGNKIAEGRPLLFSSISLLTPDHLRHFVASISEGNASFDEKSMLEIQVRAYQDLQKEIDSGGIVVNGHVVQAKILPFNWGVNELSLLKPGTDPVIGSLINGHDVSNALCNEQSLNELVGLPEDGAASTSTNETDRFLTDAYRRLIQLQSQQENAEIKAEIEQLKEALEVVPQLQMQIRQIWSDGSYRSGGNEPYKMPARIALLTHYLSGGTLFNCKSGKDRTAQLDIETKFLAFQIETTGKVPEPARIRTIEEKSQLAHFVFHDEARRTMQEYNTGSGGSKMSADFHSLFENFLYEEQDQNLSDDIRSEFIGRSKLVKS